MIVFRKSLFFLLILIITIFLFSGIFAWVYIYTPGNVDKIIASILDGVRNNSGYDIKVQKVTIKNSFRPQINVNFEKFIVYTPDNKVLFKTKEGHFSVKLFPLLQKKILISDIYLKRPVINLDYDTSSVILADITEINFNGFKIDNKINKLIAEKYKFKVKDKETTKLFIFEGESLLLSSVDLRKGLGIKTSGTLYSGEKKFLDYTTDMYILSDLLKQSKNSFSPFKFLGDYQFSGKLISTIKLKKSGEKILADGSLNIDDFSFSLKNHRFEKNSFNFIFENDRLKFNSLLRISESDCAKLDGEFKSGRNKRLLVNSVAKNINLSTLKEFYNVISHIINIPFFSEYKLTGRGNFDFRIETDFNNLKSSGVATVTDGKIEHKNIPFKIKDINSTINFNNNKIVIQKATARFNDNLLSVKGDISSNLNANVLISAENLSIKNLAEPVIPDKIFKLTGGALNFNAALKGQLNKNFILSVKSNLKNVGGNNKDKSLILKPSDLNINLEYCNKKVSGNIKGDDLIINSLKNQSEIKLMNYDLTFDDNSANLKNGKIKIFDSLLNINFHINNFLKDNCAVSLIISAAPNAVDLKKLTSIFISQPCGAKGKIPLKINFEYKKNSPLKIALQAAANRDNYLSFVVLEEVLNKTSVFNFDVLYDKDSLKAEDISLYNLENVPINTALSTTYDKTKKVLTLSGRLSSIKEMIFDNIKINIPESITGKMTLGGGVDMSLKGNFVLNGSSKQPKITGLVHFNKLCFPKHHATIRNMALKLSDNIINVNIPDAEISGSKFSADFDMLPKFNDKIEILNPKVSADDFNLTTLIKSFEKIKPDEFFPGVHVPLVIKNGKGVVNKLYVDNYNITNLGADFAFYDDTLFLQNVTGKAFEGEFLSSLQYNFLTMSLKSQTNAKHFNVNTLIKSATNSYTDIQGTTDFQSDISLRLCSSGNEKGTLRGNANFTLSDLHLGVLGQFEKYLQAQNIVHSGIDSVNYEKLYSIARTYNTSYFKSGEGMINFESGIINIDRITLQGKLMSLLVSGKHNLVNDYSNINFYGRISNAVLGEPDRQTVALHNEIPQLLDNANYSDSEFKVNIKGDVKNIRSVNSFQWLSY